MFNNILAVFPKKETYDTYIEPFGGSYTVGMHMDYIPPVEIYNDLEKNVYSLQKVLSTPELYDQFKVKCDLCYYDENTRAEYRELLKKNDISVLDRAFMFFYVNRTSHNGIGGFSCNTIVRRNMAKSVSDMLSCIDRMPEVHQRMSHVLVRNCDGVELIKKYNRPNVFIYADPPYEQSTRGSARYAIDMDSDGHNRFIDACIASNAKILISGYDCELYDRLLENGFEKVNFEVNTITGTYKPKTKVETLWKNY